ncbi:hypothetical protein ACI8AA_01420 [Geodermatophilus sp. SYSU D01180]
MPDALSLLLPLLFLAGISAVLLRGRRPAFRPASADARFGSVQGPLMATWLALVAATWTLLDLAGTERLPVAPSVVATLVLAVLVGLVAAPRATLFVLAAAGLAGQFLALADDHGLSVAAGLIAVTGLVTWLFGALRGLLSPRAGAGRLVAAGVVIVVLLQVTAASWAGPGDPPAPVPAAGDAR